MKKSKQKPIPANVAAIWGVFLYEVHCVYVAINKHYEFGTTDCDAPMFS